jgi:hypothetical protein
LSARLGQAPFFFSSWYQHNGSVSVSFGFVRLLLRRVYRAAAKVAEPHTAQRIKE